MIKLLTKSAEMFYVDNWVITKGMEYSEATEGLSVCMAAVAMVINDHIVGGFTDKIKEAVEETSWGAPLSITLGSDQIRSDQV